MGLYINPSNKTKEKWLVENGTLTWKNNISSWIDCYNKNLLPVLLIDNGPFTTAAICFSEKEYNDFIDPYDYRPKKFYLVNIEKLKEVSSNLDKYINLG